MRPENVYIAIHSVSVNMQRRKYADSKCINIHPGNHGI